MTEKEFVAVVKENNKRVFLIALSFTKNKSDSEDIMQNVFLKLWRSEIKFESKEHIVKWLTVVTSNESKNLIKYLSRRRSEELSEISDSFTFDNDGDRDLFNAVMSLPPKLSLVIHLFYYEDLSIKEIAETLKLSESAVKTRLNRGRNQLKESLGGYWKDE